MASPAKIAKGILRQKVKDEIAKLSMEERIRQSQVVTKRLFALPHYQRSQRVSIYLHMQDEIQTRDILQNILQSGKQCFIPRYEMRSSHMDMVRLHSMADFDSLPLTKWQIKQPALDEPREEALTSGGLDLVLVPGLAFSRAGHRLGRGRGYYDRFLNRCRAAQGHAPFTVALAFRQQVLDHVEVEETDVPMDVVLFDDEE